MELKALDYSNSENWAIFEEHPTKAADAIWIYGTLAQTPDLPNGRAEMTPPLRAGAAFLAK